MFLRTSRIIIEVLVAIVVIAALLAGAAVWRLSQGPVALGSAKPYLERALSRPDGSLDFKLDSTVFQWAGWRRSLDIRGIGARMVARDGRVVASVPEVSVSFSLLALARGRFAATRVELINPTVRLTRTKDGEFQFGFGRETGTSGEFLPGVLQNILAGPGSGNSVGMLRRVSVVGARLTVRDEILGVSWRAPNAEFELGPDGDGLEAAYQLEIAMSAGQGSNPVIEGTARFTPGDRAVQFDLAFNNLNPVHVSRTFRGAKDYRAFDLPLRGRAEFELDIRGSVRQGSFEIRSGAGSVELPAVFDAPLSVAAAEARGQFDSERGKIRLEHSVIETEGGEIQFRAAYDKAGRVSTLSGDMVLAGLQIAALQRLWPKELAANARDWVRRNMTDGNAEGRAAFFLKIPDNPEAPTRVDRFGANLELFGTSIHFLRPLPPVKRTDATMVFGIDRIDVTVHRGELNGLDVGEGKIAMTSLNEAISWFELDTVVTGKLRSALEVLDHPRLGFIRGRGIRTAAVSGKSATRLNIRLPMLKALKLRDVAVKAASNLKDVSISEAVPGFDLTGGVLALRLNSKNMSIAGKVRLAGADTDLKWYENFQDHAKFVRRFELAADIGQQTLAALDLGFDIGMSGTIPSKVILTERRNRRADVNVRLGLKRSALSIPALDWKKPAGRPGGVVLDLVMADGKLRRVRQFHVRSELLTASATAQFDDTGTRLVKADLSEFVVGDKTEISATARHVPEKGLQVHVKGPRFNAMPFARLFEPNKTKRFSLPPMDVKANVRRVWIRPQVALNYVDASLHYNGQGWNNIFMVSELSRARRLAVGYIERSGQAKITMEASDAGVTLKTFGIFDDVEGGVLNVSAVQETPGPGGLWRGKLSVSNFRIRKAPQLARLLSLASLAGIADVMAGPGLTFNRLILPFSLGKGRLDVYEARAVGSAIGITATGHLGLQDERIDIKGTIIPAYTINSVLGNIPILGAIFTGGKGKGVFAATYAVKGPLEEPKVSVNPLAVLAPGFLRNLLQGIIDGGAPAGQLPQPSQNE